MDRVQLKQRIVGAVVLVALGVIFIPMILNRDDNVSGISGTNIPAKPPELEQLAQQTPPPVPAAPAQPAETPQVVDQNTPKLPDVTESAKPPADAAATPATPSLTEEKKPLTAEQGKARGWVVQVASFTERSKALQLRDRLRKAKYTCFVESVTSKQSTLYRVRVGPVLKREEADALQAKIAKQLKLKDTLVMAHP